MFKVPIIPFDLRHEETITQAAYALDCLQKIITSIFCQIDKRIEKNNVKVSALQERIKKSQDKINSLQGTRKAIHIYAPARYPSADIFKDLSVTFNADVKDIYKENRELVRVCQIQSKLEANWPNASEKLIFFHVRNNTVKLRDNCVAKKLFYIQQNLGKMPSDLRSIPSVLLFNTDCSVYHTDDFDNETDSWKRAKLFKNKRQHHSYKEQIIVKQILDPAPHSLANRHNEKLTPSGGLKYTPKLNEAPELDLPLDLPDLPGIADDLRYENQEAKLKIAPSLVLAVENLPELTELMKDNLTTIKNKDADLETINADALLPLPPSPTRNKSVVSTPPPPPPPPPAFQLRSPTISDHTNISISQSAPTGLDTRSELMAAIRNAGGVAKAHLRRTAAAPIVENKDDVDNKQHSNNSAKNQNYRSSQSGDLMADLHNKLLMRRKGISGSKDTNENPNTNIKRNNVANTVCGNTVISRLSALIPPPTAKIQTQNTATTSDDDGDDSNDTDWVD